MPLENKIQLCYIKVEDLWEWIKENQLLTQDFTQEKKKWAKEISQPPNFFSDTELLLIYQDTFLLKTLTDSQMAFLAKTYQLEGQKVCQKLFQAKKNIIIISNKQWKLRELENNEKAIVLFKDKEDIEKQLVNWLKEVTN